MEHDIGLYQANEELVTVLRKQGFFESSAKFAHLQENRRFKLSKNSTKEIYIEKHQILIWNRGQLQESRVSLSRAELALTLLYFKVSPPDFRVFFPDATLVYDKALVQMRHLQSQAALSDSAHPNSRSPQKIRIITLYEQLIASLESA